MQERNSLQWGFITINSLIIVIITLILCVGFMFLLSALKNYSHRMETRDTIHDEAITLLYDIAEKMNALTEDNADSPFSPGVRMLEREYVNFQLIIQDVSSGINVRFLNENILNDDSIKRLITYEPDNNVVTYGWAHKRIVSQVIKARIKESFLLYDDESLFPLINEFPLTNIHYLSFECISAFLHYYRIDHAEEKANLLHERVQNELVTDIKKLLRVNEQHEILNIIGTKTTFWKISYKYQNYVVEAIFCAIPDRIDPGKIERYKLVERTMRLSNNE